MKHFSIALAVGLALSSIAGCKGASTRFGSRWNRSQPVATQSPTVAIDEGVQTASFQEPGDVTDETVSMPPISVRPNERTSGSTWPASPRLRSTDPC